MYCPRCGTQANQTTKYCRSCGLPLLPVINYVSTGGTSTLQPPVPESPKSENSMVRAFQELEPKQQMTFSILFFIFLVPLLGVLSGIFPPFRALVPLAAIGMPLGIVWSVMRYKAFERRMQQQLYANSFQPQVHPPTQFPQQTAYQPPTMTAPTTNQLDESQLYPPPSLSSVTEDETRRLPNQPQREQH